MRFRVKTYVPFYIIGALLSFFGIVTFFIHSFGLSFYFNLTQSAPHLAYLAYPSDIAPEVGDRVALSFPDKLLPFVESYPWLKQAALIKQVGALPGDEYCVSDTEFRIDGELVGAVFSHDSHGNKLPSNRGCFVVPRGHFLPVSTAKTSFDGRYFGTVSLRKIVGNTVPILPKWR